MNGTRLRYLNTLKYTRIALIAIRFASISFASVTVCSE